MQFFTLFSLKISTLVTIEQGFMFVKYKRYKSKITQNEN